MPIRDIDTWNSGIFRLTIFPIVGQEIDPQTVFETIAGVPAEEIRSQREIGQTSVTSRYGPNSLQLVVQPDRIHWALSAHGEQRPDEVGFPVVGPYTESLEIFRALAIRWIENDACPDITRIAYGAVLLSSVESQSAGYEWLARYIPSLNIEPQAVSDLIYQINRWRILGEGLPGLKVNRIEKWSVAVAQITGLQMIPTGIRQIAGERAFALRLELDINTDQAREDVLPRDSIPSVFNELVQLGTEIAQEGDIP